MVLTPEFTISQDDNFIYISIKCPNVRAKEMELLIIDNEFHFSADPYLLVLHFQHRVLDNENGTAQYNVETGFFTAKLEKENHGEDFPEILLLSTLKPKPNKSPMIQVLDRTSTLEYVDYDPDPTKYGFNFWASNYFENVQDTIPYVTDLPSPDSIPYPRRHEMRLERELEDFDADQIMLDYVQPPQYDITEADVFLKEYTPEENRKLLQIPLQEFLMSRETAKINFFNCVDVVYSTVYDVTLFGIEGTCESHWTISKISSTLSWFDIFESSSDLILSTLKRVLVYPMYRSYHFSKLCWDKTVEMLRNGRTSLLKCLLHTKEMLEKGEFRWRLNRLYIDPMIVWLQELDQKDYIEFSDEVCSAVENFPKKEDVEEEWCIDLLEKLAEKQRDELTRQPKDVGEFEAIGEYAKNLNVKEANKLE